MTADDTTAAAAPAGAPAARDAATPADPGHGRRALARIGAGAIAAWIAEVVTPRRRIVACAVGLLAGVGSALLLRRLFLGMEDAEDADTGLAIGLGLVIGAVACSIPLASWLARASRRLGSATGAHPHWRDAALLEGSVDARGRVTLASGVADRVAVESRRAIASGAIGVPAAFVLTGATLVAAPILLVAGMAAHQLLVIPLYLVMSATTVSVTCRVAGPMALLRDAADAELALPEHERSVAPPVEPPHGSRLP